MPEKQDYIANSISRILMAPCLPSKHFEREKDMADAVRHAGSFGAKAAHDYLKKLCDEAENGKYSQEEFFYPEEQVSEHLSSNLGR